MTVTKYAAQAMLMSLLVGCGGGENSTGDDTTDQGKSGGKGNPVTTPNKAPLISAAMLKSSVPGADTVVLGNTLTLEYTYSDAEGDADAGPVEIRWMSSDKADGNYQVIAAADKRQYLITKADSGKFIKAAFKPSASKGTTPGVEFSTAAVEVSNAAPTITSAQIRNTKANAVAIHAGHTLALSYQFADLEGDADGGLQQIRWMISDTAGGVFQPIANASGESYQVVKENSGKFIKAAFKPSASAGTTPGAEFVTAAVAVVNSGPVVTSAAIRNSLSDAPAIMFGHTLTLDYQYSDAEGDASAGAKEIRWMRSDSAADGFEIIAGADTEQYTVGTGDLNKYIRVAFKASASTGTKFSAEYTTASVNVPDNKTPVAADVVIKQQYSLNPSKTIEVGDIVQAQYSYSDSDGDSERNSTYSWYINNDDGSRTELGSQRELTVPFAARGKALNLAVTPHARQGIPQGETQNTSLQLPALEEILFTAKNAAGELLLYKTDGSAESITELKNLQGAEISQPLKLKEGVWVFMYRLTAASDNELWVSNGTAAGTVRLQNPDNNFTGVRGLALVNDQAMFSARGNKGQELWSISWRQVPGEDSERAHFVMYDVVAGNLNSDPANMVYAPPLNAVFFTAIAYNDEGTSRGRELHILDFDEQTGARMVKDIRHTLGVDHTGSVPLHMTWFKDRLYFSAWDGSDATNGGTGRTLWTSDGTANGTVSVLDLDVGKHSYPAGFTAAADDLYFISNNNGNTASGRIWVTRGTEETTQKFREDLHGEASFVTAFPANGSVIYRATPTSSHPPVYWQLKTRNSAAVSLNVTSFDDSKHPVDQPFIKNNRLIYANYTSDRNYHLSETVFTGNDDDLRNTRTIGSIKNISESDLPKDLVEVNGRILFSAWGGQFKDRELYYIDPGVSTKPVLLKEFVAGENGSDPKLKLPATLSIGEL